MWFRYFAVFFMKSDGSGNLEFIENLEYKFIELLTVNFIASSEEQIRHNITYRYSLLKVKMFIV